VLQYNGDGAGRHPDLVSDEEERWTKFKEPLHDVLISSLKVVRTVLLAAVR